MATFTGIRTQADNKEGWELISTAAPFVMGEFIEGAKTENPTGPLPFKITKEERQTILKRLDELFGDSLEKFYAYKAGHGNAKDQTYVIFTVNNIKNYLVPNTYEEAAALKSK